MQRQHSQQTWQQDGPRIAHVPDPFSDALADTFVQPPPDEQPLSLWDGYIHNRNPVDTGIPNSQYSYDTHAFGSALVQPYDSGSNTASNIGGSNTTFANVQPPTRPCIFNDVNQHSNDANATSYGTAHYESDQYAQPAVSHPSSFATPTQVYQPYSGSNHYNAMTGCVAAQYTNASIPSPHGFDPLLVLQTYSANYNSNNSTNNSNNNNNSNNFHNNNHVNTSTNGVGPADPSHILGAPPPYTPDPPIETTAQLKFDCPSRALLPLSGTGRSSDHCCYRDKFQGLRDFSHVKEHLLLYHGILCPGCRCVLQSKDNIEMHRINECTCLHHDHEGRPTATGEIQKMIDGLSSNGTGSQSATNARGELQYDLQGLRHMVAGQQGTPISRNDLEQIVKMFTTRARASNATKGSPAWYNDQGGLWFDSVRLWFPRFDRDEFEGKYKYSISPYFEKNKQNEANSSQTHGGLTRRSSSAYHGDHLLGHQVAFSTPTASF